MWEESIQTGIITPHQSIVLPEQRLESSGMMQRFSNDEVKPNASENKYQGETYDWKEQELIQELVRRRMAQNSEIEYEDLTGYEIPPRTQFSMLSKPAVSIKYRKMTFNTSAVKLFGDVLNIVPSFNKDKKRFAALPCKEEEAASVAWARKKDDNTIAVKEITSEEFVEKIFSSMGWDRNCRYKALGRITNSDRGLILVFDLKEAIQYAPTLTEYTDPITGEIKKRSQAYYPEMYKGRIGKSYSDYKEEHQITLFEYLEGYTGKTYSDMPDQNVESYTGEVVDN